MAEVERQSGGDPGPIADAVCLFVSSSDNTRDIFLQVSRSIQKYWPDCPFPLYAGFNSPGAGLPSGFRPVYAPVGDWPSELHHQLRQLPPALRYILLFLDDFLILSPVDTERVMALVEQAVRAKMPYLRLIPQTRALLPFLWKRAAAFSNRSPWEKIKTGAPYVSSLQVALWDRVHLSEMLRGVSDIWGFENHAIAGAAHFAVVRNPPIRFVHTVEKGQWEPDAGFLFRRAGLAFDPAERKVRPVGRLVSRWLGRWKFAIIGYAVFRLKRYKG